MSVCAGVGCMVGRGYVAAVAAGDPGRERASAISDVSGPWSSTCKATHCKATHCEATQCKATQCKATHCNATQ